jgi:hypothetical protein
VNAVLLMAIVVGAMLAHVLGGSGVVGALVAVVVAVALWVVYVLAGMLVGGSEGKNR